MIPFLVNCGADLVGFELMSHYTADALFYFYLGIPCLFFTGINFAIGINLSDQARSFKNIGMYGNIAFLSSALSFGTFVMFPSIFEINSFEYMLG